MLTQLVLNAVIAGSLFALVGVGFAMIYRVVHFYHFTYGLAFTVAAYALLTLWRRAAIPFVAAVPLAVLLTVLLGVAFESVVFRRLRDRGQASDLGSFIASLGLYIVGQNLISLSFGDAAQSLRSPDVHLGVAICGARITHAQIGIILCSAAGVMAAGLWLRFSSAGKRVRAVSGDRDLACIVGIHSQRTIALAVGIGTAFAALGGVLSALDRDLVPTMGMNALLMAVVATVVGGAGSMPGIVAAALLIALTQNLSILVIPAAWQDAVAFAILIAFLIARPEGVCGRPLRRWLV
jgi:branched-chain amino acid transport system permease protein